MQLTNTFEPISALSSHLAEKLVRIYENPNSADLDGLREIYSQDICFENPVHGIQGLDELVSHFEMLCQNVDRLRFKLHRSIISSDGIFLSWTMILEHESIRRGQVIRVEGASYLKYRDDKVYYHRDYFDLGAMVYENVPILGGIIRLIRTRMEG